MNKKVVNMGKAVQPLLYNSLKTFCVHLSIDAYVIVTADYNPGISGALKKC
jgi:hypothetical protein